MNRTLFACGLRQSVELKDGKLHDIKETLERKKKERKKTKGYSLFDVQSEA